jgi:hypothetical protein
VIVVAVEQAFRATDALLAMEVGPGNVPLAAVDVSQRAGSRIGDGFHGAQFHNQASEGHLTDEFNETVPSG